MLAKAHAEMYYIFVLNNYSQNLSEFSENVGFAGVVVDHVRHTLYQNGARVSVNYLLSGGFANSWFISFLFHFILYEKLNIYKRVCTVIP